MNLFKFKALIYRLLVEGLSVDSVVQRLRREHRDDFKGVTNAPIEKAVQEIDNQVSGATTPMARAYLDLHMGEVGLRGDLQEALSNIEPAGPAHTRELAQLFARLAQKESGGMDLQRPDELDEAIAAIEAGYEGDTAVFGFRQRTDALYPPADTTE